MKNILTTSLGSLVIASALFVALPAFAANDTVASTTRDVRGTVQTTRTDRGHGRGEDRFRNASSTSGVSRDQDERGRGRVLSTCLKTAEAKRNAALHAAQATFRQSSLAPATGSTASTTDNGRNSVARTAYKDAIRLAQTTFASERKVCLKK